MSHVSDGVGASKTPSTILFDSGMFLSHWCHIGGFYRQPSERLEAFVADSQHPGTAVLVILLVIILGLILFNVS